MLFFFYCRKCNSSSKPKNGEKKIPLSLRKHSFSNKRRKRKRVCKFLCVCVCVCVCCMCVGEREIESHHWFYLRKLKSCSSYPLKEKREKCTIFFLSFFGEGSGYWILMPSFATNPDRERAASYFLLSPTTLALHHLEFWSRLHLGRSTVKECTYALYHLTKSC